MSEASDFVSGWQWQCTTNLRERLRLDEGVVRGARRQHIRGGCGTRTILHRPRRRLLRMSSVLDPSARQWSIYGRPPAAGLLAQRCSGRSRAHRCIHGDYTSGAEPVLLSCPSNDYDTAWEQAFSDEAADWETTGDVLHPRDEL